MPKLGIAMSEAHPQPHFASHTQSSLMKARTPMKFKKKPLLRKDMSESKKSQGTIIFRLNGIHKRRNNVIKQSRSMQMLITILKQQQRDRRTTGFFHGDSELIETTCLLENSCVSLPSDLINDISCDLKKSTGSPAKLAANIRSKLTKVVDESEKHVKDLYVSFQDGINREENDNSEDTHNSSKDHTVTNVACKLQFHLSDEEESVDSCSEDVHQRPTESKENLNDIPNKVCSEAQVHQGANATTNRKRFRKYWQNRKVQNQHVDNPGNNSSTKEKPIVNAATTTRKKNTFQKNSANQRAWRPPGVSKTWVTESATSLQPVSQKSSQSVERSTTSMKSKHSLIEYINESTSASVSVNQTKMLMKENRDPRANRMTKICEHLTETKQRQRLQGEGALPKTRRSKTKIGPKDQRNNANLPSPSKSRHSQTPPIMLMESSNIEPHCAESALYKRRTRTLKVIHELKEIINNGKEDEDAEKSVVKNDDYDHETNSEVPTSPNHDTLQSNDIYTKDVNLNKADQFSRRSIGTQTELDIPLHRKIDTEKDQDGTFKDKTLKVLTELLKLTRSVATQTSSSYNKNVVDIGCNTSNIICNDVEVSCDLTSFTNLETKDQCDPITIEDKSMSVPTSVKHIVINVGNGDTNKNEDLPLAKCEKTLNTQMSLKLENCDNMEITPEPTNDASGETEKICQKVLQSPKNFNDKTSTDVNKHQESTECFSNHSASSTSVNKLERSSNCDYDAKEVAKCFENEDSSKLKVKDIPSDVIAAFELAAERARNLHEAVNIYYKNLMSKVSEKRNEEMVGDCGTSKRHDFEKYAFFKSYENEDNIQNEKIQDEIQREKSEYEGIYDWPSTKDYAEISSSSSNSSDLISNFEYQSILKYIDIESDIFSGEEEAVTSSNVNECPELEDMKSLVCRTEDEYALELLERTSENSDESFEMESLKNYKILALPAANKETFFISRANLFPLIFCVCTIIFWCLQFSFQCDSTK